MEYDDEGRLVFGQELESEDDRPYDHHRWLSTRRRSCPRGKETEPMMRVANMEDVIANGAWPYFVCKVHGTMVAF